ncbi:CS1 type fimbrial major subunit [Pseudomonas sp. NPDC007930]|uniref:CS1 type fimbrial major subunit n=1 Tax=Pseudomonas sp. NPDC007930 TaxID=3364417 RepID=UPI0036EDC515
MKKYLLVPLALAAATQFASADPITRQIKVTANIPASVFTIRDEGNWMNQEQRMGLDENGNLLGIQQRLYVKSSEPLTAKFTSPPTITGLGQNIPLTLNIGGTDVNATTPTEFISAADAGNGRTLDVVLGAAPGPYKPANYFGYMNVVFDVKAP